MQITTSPRWISLTTYSYNNRGVDMYTDDKLSVTRIPMKKLYTEELDKETMENIERQFKCNGFEIEIKQEYYISFINYYM